jgi:hypothetical protein
MIKPISYTLLISPFSFACCLALSFSPSICACIFLSTKGAYYGANKQAFLLSTRGAYGA